LTQLGVTGQFLLAITRNLAVVLGIQRVATQQDCPLFSVLVFKAVVTYCKVKTTRGGVAASG